jgi:ADP-ribose pyrophosphatase YjhB (NUDIX family)
LTSDHANFHLKQLVQNEFVEHVPKVYGTYRLTRKGKEYANRMDTDENKIEKQPKISVVLVIVNEKGEHLQQERLKQPYYGYWGHPTGKIRWGETLEEAGARELMEETGLVADLTPLGFYHKLDYDANDELLEDKYLCLIYGTNPRGELKEYSDGQRNVWLSDDEFEKKEKKFGGAIETTQFITSGQPFLREKKYMYPSDAY